MPIEFVIQPGVVAVSAVAAVAAATLVRRAKAAGPAAQANAEPETTMAAQQQQVQAAVDIANTAVALAQADSGATLEQALFDLEQAQQLVKGLSEGLQEHAAAANADASPGAVLQFTLNRVRLAKAQADMARAAAETKAKADKAAEKEKARADADRKVPTPVRAEQAAQAAASQGGAAAKAKATTTAPKRRRTPSPTTVAKRSHAAAAPAAAAEAAAAEAVAGCLQRAAQDASDCATSGRLSDVLPGTPPAAVRRRRSQELSAGEESSATTGVATRRSRSPSSSREADRVDELLLEAWADGKRRPTDLASHLGLTTNHRRYRNAMQRLALGGSQGAMQLKKENAEGNSAAPAPSAPVPTPQAGQGDDGVRLTDEELKMKKNMTVVAKLDRLPTPPLSMHGYTSGGKAKSSGQDSGALSRRFAKR
eukprot:TRINITY_DN17676_c0_g1_i1.p1 TRINITY_DN17676_c0_g1~~TRINITY_DN17676_c0_g1_i1.p1  ORF type:complete len:424 (+),score=136.20 TRINITY_DN17676_c0_g1_i1:74-1345(+)